MAEAQAAEETAEVAADDRAEPPSADQIAAAATEIQRVFREEYAAAKKQTDKAALAEKLLTLVPDSTDASERYALLSDARRLAIAAGNPALALQAADALAENFAVDRFEQLAKTAEELADRDLSSAARKEMAEAIEPLAGAALAAGQFSSGRRLATVGLAAARKANQNDLAKSLVRQGKELAAGEKLAASAADARTRLADNPDDPKANETLGKYLCLYVGDWPAGLPHLAKADDAALRAVAELETAADPTPGAQAKLGDAWWDLSAHGGADADRMRARAGDLYRQAVGSLAGLTKTRIEKRLEEIPLPAANVQPLDKIGSKPAGVAGASRRPTPKIGQWFDLLAITDPAKQHREDHWHRTAAGLLADQGKYYPLQLPAEIMGNFDLHFEFTPDSSGGASFAFPVGSGRACVAVGGEVAGLDPFEGKNIADNATTVRHERLESGKRYAVDISVRCRDPQQVAIMARLDGAQILQWQGKADSLGMYDFWNTVPPQAVGLNAWTKIVFHVAKLRLLSGSTAINQELATSLPAAVPNAKNHEKSSPADKVSGGVIADKLVVWNCNNHSHKDRGMLTCNVELRKDGKVVWSKQGVPITWSADEEPATTIPLPKIAFDTLRVETASYHSLGAGLCEVEIFRGTPISLRGSRRRQAEISVRQFPASAAVDGIRDSSQAETGYWLGPDRQTAWIEVQVAPPAEQAKEKYKPAKGGATSGKWISKDATYTLHPPNDVQPPLPSLLSENENAYGTPGDEYAFQVLGQSNIVIDLKRSKMITGIYIRNRVVQDRSAGLRVYLSNKQDEAVRKSGRPARTCRSGRSSYRGRRKPAISRLGSTQTRPMTFGSTCGK